MRINTQYKISITIFTVALIIIAGSIILTSEAIAKTRSKENLAINIAKGAGDLAYISNDFVVYHTSQQLAQWQTSYASFSQNIANLNASTPEQKVLVQDIRANQLRMKTVFDNIVKVIGTSNQSESASSLQISWSMMSAQTQTVTAEANQLSQLLSAQVDQLNFQNLVLIAAIIGTFAVFLSIIYIQTFRRTLKSLSKLETGTAIIGSGNLDYKLDENKKDEIGKLSKSFNQMTVNLKSVMASKAELEQAQASLRESEQRWATTLASIGDAVIATDSGGKIGFMNGEAEALTGWKLSEASQTPTRDVFRIVNEQTRLEVESPIERVLREGMVVGLANHTILIQKDGIEVPIDDSGAPIRDRDGKTTGVVLVFRDITERKKTEDERIRMQTKLKEYASQMEQLAEQRAQQLKNAERLAAIGATAGMVGHDIRNPLQAITGDIYLAKTDLASTPDSEEKNNVIESLEEIEKNVVYINKIVQDLQDFARPLNPRTEETDLEAIIDDLLEKNDFPKNVELSVKIEAKKIVADSTYINRIMYNLVNNAVQAMPNGGKLTIHTYKQSNDTVIAVKDTGIGIPEAIKGKLFTPMFTTKSKGQGFGLAVIKRMTEASGGTVFFESQEGKGTTFIVRLPLKKNKT